ncbi:MAG: GatB/YqeY domain-containing protein [Patescibacteria group bacterium]
MPIHETLKKSIPDAMRAHDAVRLQTLRSLITQMTNEVVAKKRKPDEFLTDEEALAVIKRAANQRKDSIEQFEKGGRPELAVSEKAELVIIEAYLPAMMSREEIEAVVKAKMTELGVSSEADAAKTPEGRSPGASLEALRGKLTGTLMKELKGKADGGDVKAVVDKLLS